MLAFRPPTSLILLAAWATLPEVGQIVPPVARKTPTTFRIHQGIVVDSYAWLENRSDPEVRAYLEAENQYAAAVMKGTEPLQQKLYREMASRIDETDPQPPLSAGGHAYYLRSEPGKQYLLLCRRPGGAKSREEVLFDLNTLADAGGKPSLGVWRVSPDGRHLAWSVDNDGSETFTVFVRSLEDRLKPAMQFSGAGRWLEWSADGQTLFNIAVHSHSPDQLIRRRITQPGSAPETVYSESSPRNRLAITKTKTGDHLLLITYRADWEVRFLPSTMPSGDFVVLGPRRVGVQYLVAQEGGAFYLLVNGPSEPSRVFRVPAASPAESAWEEVLAAGQGIHIQDLDVVNGKLIAQVREEGLTKIRVHDFEARAQWFVPFPELLSQARIASNLQRELQIMRAPGSTSVHLFYESYVQPSTMLECDLDKRRLRPLWRSSVRNFHAGEYESSRIYAAARDGTQIPISLVYRKPLRLDGRRPLLLYGYGSMGVSIEPSFETERLSLLDRGIVYAVAHVRGGGELGGSWHQAATGVNKILTFTDFIDCAQHLIKQKFTSPNRLATTGASAGGMLVLGAANMRPDLFQAIVAKVPVVEVFYRQPGSANLRAMSDTGDPNLESDFNAILSYAPYYNVKAQRYPHMLITGSWTDPRVSYSEPAKFAARLRSLKTDGRMLLLRVDMQGGGHLGPSGREDRLRQTALEHAFLLRALNVRD